MQPFLIAGIAVAAFFFAGGVLASLTQVLGLAPAAAAMAAVTAGTAVFFFGLRLFDGFDSDADRDAVLT